MQKLLPNEQTLIEADGGRLVVTNYCVRQNLKVGNAEEAKTIPLDAVAHCAVVKQSRPVLLLLAALAGFGAISQSNQEFLVALAIVALAFIVAYFGTRVTVITILSSSGASITLPAKRMSAELTANFVQTIIGARLDLLVRLKR